MADNSVETGNGAAKAEDEAQPNIHVAAQFIRDLSFENPNIEKFLSGPGENPNLEIEVNVNAKPTSDKLYESAIEFSAKAVAKAGVIYEIELVYAGLFHLENIPEEAIQPFLLIHAPALLFPFLRRLVADVTREGGFPPLLLDPIDFGHLYEQRLRQQQAGNDNQN